MKTTRKNFIKSTAVLGLGTLSLGLQAKSLFSPGGPEIIKPVNGKYELPPLGYSYAALEPFIDARTLELHHAKHHQAYINKLNEVLDMDPTLKTMDLNELLFTLQARPEKVRNTVRNQGGGHWNHTFFWQLLKLNTNMGPGFSKMAIASFGSVDAFKKEFEKAAMGIFGSGWAWVLAQNGKLRIVTTSNQDNPIMDMAMEPEIKGRPILGIDVWEHAYYLKHQNKRVEYVSGFWSVINWDQVEQNLNK